MGLNKMWSKMTVHISRHIELGGGFEVNSSCAKRRGLAHLSACCGSCDIPVREAPRGRRTISRDSVTSACTTKPGTPTTTGWPAARSVASTLYDKEE